MKKTLFLPLIVALALSACKKTEDGKANLPPAAGEGAAPLPDIPNVEPTKVDGAGAGTAKGPEPGGPARTTGTLAARADVKVGPKTQGTIVSLAVEEGAHVKKGDVLFRLDTSDAVLMRRTASTALSGAKVQLAAAQREFDRMSRLVKENAMPRAQLDALQTQVDAAKVAIAAAQNQLAMANKQINDATVRSPLSGVVLQRLMSVGEYASMMPPSPVYVLQDQSTLELKFPIAERDITSVKNGDHVIVTLGALGQTRKATISQIAPMVNPQTRTIELTALLANCDGNLVPGMMAEVQMGEPPAGTQVFECPTEEKKETKPKAQAKTPAKGKGRGTAQVTPKKGTTP